jgi:enoyl-CoA hydratase/carnithine racemase
VSQPEFETLLYSVEEGVATITLNRPDRMNAFTPQMMADMIAAFDATDADDDVRCVIVTGSGERAFCAGADLGSGGSTFDYASRGDQIREEAKVGDVYRDGGGRVTLRIYDSLKPVIAAVNGAAVGIGVTMQLAMDIRLASTTARFGFVFARRGITPEAASSWFLPRLVGMQTALEWCYTGRVFPAQEALDRGLVRSLHEPADLLPAARALAREIADNTAPVSIALTRQLLWRGAGFDHPMQAHKADSRAIMARGASGDAREGVGAFLEKRPPAYPNKVSTDLPDIWPEWEEREFR